MSRGLGLRFWDSGASILWPKSSGHRWGPLEVLADGRLDCRVS